MLCFHFLFLCNLKKYSQQRGNFLLSQGRKWHRKEVKWCFLWLLRLEVNIHAGSGDRRGGGNITVYSGCSALSQCYTGHTRHKPAATHFNQISQRFVFKTFMPLPNIFKPPHNRSCYKVTKTKALGRGFKISGFKNIQILQY